MSTLERLRILGEEMAVLLREAEAPEFKEPISAIKAAAREVGKSWSGSWFGYQANVYYRDWQQPPPGARFSQEWGLIEAFSNGTVGTWDEWSSDQVEAAILLRANSPDLESLHQAAQVAAEKVLEAKAMMLSLFTGLTRGITLDKTFTTLLSDLEQIRMVEEDDILNSWHGRGQIVTRDMRALNEGTRAPGHMRMLARAATFSCPYDAAKELARIARHIAIHAEVLQIGSEPVNKQEVVPAQPKRVFIGHGRSPLWRELKDYVEGDLGLPSDEFNRIQVAGIHTTERLQQMLDEASIALLVLTAEDERNDKVMQARQNVVHEVGLFQGRLGFTRAIVLMEDSCEEFSNIAGLGQIRFPAGNISACFHKVRQVLVREGLLAKG